VTEDAALHLAESVARLLKAKGENLVTAESCTGGGVAEAITAVPGSSEWFDRGFITYSNDAKMDMLKVSADTLKTHGAVSEETAREMAAGARKALGVDVAVATTGIAGPDGGTPDKPVGTVWIGWKRRGGYAQTELFHFDGDRESVRRQTVAAALRGVQKILTS